MVIFYSGYSQFAAMSPLLTDFSFVSSSAPTSLAVTPPHFPSQSCLSHTSSLTPGDGWMGAGGTYTDVFDSKLVAASDSELDLCRDNGVDAL